MVPILRSWQVDSVWLVNYSHLQMHACVVFRTIGSDADAPVRLQLSGGFVLTIASTPSVGCDALCVRVLGGHTPVDRVQANPCVVRRVCVDFLRLGVQSD